MKLGDVNAAFYGATPIYRIFRGDQPTWPLDTTVNFLQEIKNPTPTTDANFGRWVKIYDDTLVISSQNQDSNKGSIFIYTRANNLAETKWTLQQRIDNPTGLADNFGYCITIYKDKIAVGAINEDTGAANAGTVYVYERAAGVWTLSQTIHSPIVSGIQFGYAAAMYKDDLVIGCNAGKAFAYRFNGTSGLFELMQTQLAPTWAGDGVNEFGRYIQMDKDNLIHLSKTHSSVTTAWINHHGHPCVYVKHNNLWSLQKIFTDPNYIGSVWDAYGYGSCFHNDKLAVGSYTTDTGAGDAGAVFIQKRVAGVWTLSQTINNPNPAASDYFGHSVSMSGNVMVIGAYGKNAAQGDAGTIYIYIQKDGVWNLYRRINNPTSLSDNFGVNVSIDKNNIAVGAHIADNESISNAGSVYMYTI